jgi:dienelactone hydrolase
MYRNAFHHDPAQVAGAVAAALALATLIGACSPAAGRDGSRSTDSSQSPAGSSTSLATPTGPQRIKLPFSPGSTVEGLVDAGGHDIYARCSGSGAPTVVYFTGWADYHSKRAVDLVRGIENAVAGRFRVCSYERRNTGRSEEVPGTQSPQDVVADVDGVLDALGEPGPFLLLGASYGGLVSAAYAVSHPDRVAGVVLLDSSIPDDYVIDRKHGFTGMCLAANRKTDARETLEKTDNCQLAQWAYNRRNSQPDVPLIYLAAANRDPRDVADDPIRKDFVARWAPGTFEVVDAPHWMDASDPDLVADALAEVAQLAKG